MFKKLNIFLLVLFLSANCISSDFTVKGLANYYKEPKHITKWVQKYIEYETDKVLHNRANYWQTSKETLVLMKGDCEDSAVLISDILTVLNIENYIIGIYWEDGGHAVCVYKYKGYIFLSDNGGTYELNQAKTISDVCNLTKKDWTCYSLYKTNLIRNGRNKAYYTRWPWIKKKKNLF